MLKALRERAEHRAAVERLCDVVTVRARAEIFFDAFRVADTFDGRFDLLVLHAWLVMDELRDRGEIQTSQRFVDTLFIRFDEALRELGAGDVGMSRRMKKMAAAFFGRLEAYRSATDETALAAAIDRNLYRSADGTLEPSLSLARYCFAARPHLVKSALPTGEADFGPLPDFPG
jgi:cytochrome b pre-mRNA-processing protein 3